MFHILKRALTRTQTRPQTGHKPGTQFIRQAHRRASRKPPPQPPPEPVLATKAPKKPETIKAPNGETWIDSYNWMSDKTSLRQLNGYLEQEVTYLHYVLFDTLDYQSKLVSTLAYRLATNTSTPALHLGPWLYYRRVEKGKPYPVLCRRLASLHAQFNSFKSPFDGFDYVTGQKIEQKLIDYNLEAERFGGCALEEVCELSPDHRYVAYTMYDNDDGVFKLSVRDMNNGSLCDKPKDIWVSSVAWSKSGRMLFYVVNDHHNRPCKLYRSILGSKDDAVLLLEISEEDACLEVCHTKDYNYVIVHVLTTTASKAYLIDSSDPLSKMTLVWDVGPSVHCDIEHHGGYLYLLTDAPRGGQPVDHHYLLRSPLDIGSGKRVWENIFIDDPDVVIENVAFRNTHLALIIKEHQKPRLCTVPLPFPARKAAVRLLDHRPSFLPLPKHVCKILHESNYEFQSSTMRFTLSSPVMPDAVVDYDLSSGKWNIIEQQYMLHDRSKVVSGKPSTPGGEPSSVEIEDVSDDEENPWNDVSEFYACEEYNVTSHDGVKIPLTVTCSHKYKAGEGNPVLLHVHGCYGELLDRRWRSELKTLLDRGWAIAHADVRGGGGRGKKWHHDGMRANKHNSIKDFLSCAKFLLDEKIAHENKLAAWGCDAGGLIVAAAINSCPHLFRAAILQSPFLDPTTTLCYPSPLLTIADFEEFGYPNLTEDLQALRSYSPYDNIRDNSVYPAILITPSVDSRFGVWGAAKYVARMRELIVYDPTRPILLYVVNGEVEENRYLKSQRLALEISFLIKMVES